MEWEWALVYYTEEEGSRSFDPPRSEDLMERKRVGNGWLYRNTLSMYGDVVGVTMAYVPDEVPQ